MALPVLTTFVAATADLKAAQAQAVDHLRSLGRRHRTLCDLKTFACSQEARYLGTASAPSRAAIDTVLARAGIVLCLFGETLGAPLPADFPFPPDFAPADVPAGVLHPWPAAADGAQDTDDTQEPGGTPARESMHGPQGDRIPLSGPVFELLYARGRAARGIASATSAPVPQIMALFQGDGSRHAALRALVRQGAQPGERSADFVDTRQLLQRIEALMALPLGMAAAERLADAETTAGSGSGTVLASRADAVDAELVAELETATRKGEMLRIRERIEAHPEWLALPCRDGGSLLLVAVRHGHLALVELFLQARFAPWVALEQRDSAGHHVLELALHLPDTRIAECLLARAPRLAGLPLSDGFSPLVFAVVNRRDAVVERLMRADMAVWRQPPDGAVVPMVPPQALSPDALGQQLCVVLAEPATRFAGLPLQPASDALRSHFAQLRSRQLFGALDAFDPSSLRSAALPFLPASLLLLARHASADLSVPFLITQDGDTLLAIREHAVYRSRLNRWRKTAAAELDAPQLIAYVRFSFAIALATELGIRLVESPSQVRWLPEASPAERAAFASHLSALQLMGRQHEAPALGGTFLRADQLHRGSIEIDPAMHVHLTLDECLMEQLPIAHDTAELFAVRD